MSNARRLDLIDTTARFTEADVAALNARYADASSEALSLIHISTKSQ